MEEHVCNFNDKFEVGDKDVSFIEQGHQIGAEENHQYARLTHFTKKTESTLNVRMQAPHPLVREQKLKVLQATKRKKKDSGMSTN